MIKSGKLFHFRSLAFTCLVVLSVLPKAFAEESACSVPGFAYTLEGRRDFDIAEIRARNHNVGVFRGEAITLKPWISLADNITLGIDEHGDVIQYLKYIDNYKNERKISTHLSEGVSFKSLYLRTDGQLFAIDAKGEIHVFSWERWNFDMGKESLKISGLIWGIQACGFNAALWASTAAYMVWAGLDHAPIGLVVGTSLGNVTLALLNGLRAAQRWEGANQTTNGFAPTGVKLPSPVRTGDGLWNEDGTSMVDYTLTLENRKRVSLAEFLQQVPIELLAKNTTENEFGITCEHLLLATGIHEDVWLKPDPKPEKNPKK